MTDTPKNPNNQLSLLPGFMLMGILVLFVGIGFFILNHLNTQRSEKLRQQYTQETLAFISANQPGLTTIFTELFAAAEPCNTLVYNASYNPDMCEKAISGQIFQLVRLEPLKDHSSTEFVRMSTNGNLQELSLSGNLYQHLPYDDADYKLQNLLNGTTKEESLILSESHSQSRVYVVVKDGDKILGAIVRPILER